jgi:hypothetical protein
MTRDVRPMIGEIAACPGKLGKNTGNACKHAYALELSSMELINSKFYMSCSSGK